MRGFPSMRTRPPTFKRGNHHWAARGKHGGFFPVGEGNLTPPPSPHEGGVCQAFYGERGPAPSRMVPLSWEKFFIAHRPPGGLLPFLRNRAGGSPRGFPSPYCRTKLFYPRTARSGEVFWADHFRAGPSATFFHSQPPPSGGPASGRGDMPCCRYHLFPPPTPPPG